MKTKLTKEQINYYQENGYIIIHEFLNNEELKLWSHAVDEAVNKRGKIKLKNRNEPDLELKSQWQDGEDYYDKVFIQRINLWMDNEKIRKLMTNPSLGEMAAKLANVNGIRI